MPTGKPRNPRRALARRRATARRTREIKENGRHAEQLEGLLGAYQRLVEILLTTGHRKGRRL